MSDTDNQYNPQKGNMLLGNKIRSLRDEQGILQRQVAAYLEIDTPMFGKIERGDRRAKRSQVIQMAIYFKVDEKEMLTLWLADKVLDALEGEDELKLTAIETVKEEVTTQVGLSYSPMHNFPRCNQRE